MSKQTEAQRLAENLPALFDNDLLDAVDVSGAAAELLRQEALIAELAEALRLTLRWMPVYPASADIIAGGRERHAEAINAARAALAKVKQ